MVTILAVPGDPPPAPALEEASRVLVAGFPVGIPTDTVYGLAAHPATRGATERLFAVKRRPRDVDLPVLVADVDQALALTTSVPAMAVELMERFWPGPLTIVLPRAPELDADLGDDEATIGVRCPAHPVPRALCSLVGPLATTSANRHGEPTAATALEVADAFGDDVPVVLDGGPCRGAPSTVIDCTGQHPRLLRQGRIPWEEVVLA